MFPLKPYPQQGTILRNMRGGLRRTNSPNGEFESLHSVSEVHALRTRLNLRLKMTWAIGVTLGRSRRQNQKNPREEKYDPA